MKGSGVLELKVGGGLFALRGELREQRFAARLKKFLGAFYLGHVVGVGAALEAWRQAHLHLGIDAPRECRVWRKLEGATPGLEQVERVIQVFFRCGVRAEWPEVNRRARTELPFRLLARDVGTGIGIFP